MGSGARASDTATAAWAGSLNIHRRRWQPGVATWSPAECRCTPYDRDDYSVPSERRGARSPTGWAACGRPTMGRGLTSLAGVRYRARHRRTSEAHDSGLCAASAAVRRRFASRPGQPHARRAGPEPVREAQTTTRPSGCRSATAAGSPLPSSPCAGNTDLTIDQREAAVLDAVLTECC